MIKYKNAINLYLCSIAFFEDEWADDCLRIKNLIKNYLAYKPECINQIKRVFPQETNLSNNVEVNYEIYGDHDLVTHASFIKQHHKNSWELNFTCLNEMHEILPKLLNQFIKESNPDFIIAVSDNRLFSGSIYEKNGFKFNKEIEPDYYSIKGKNDYRN